MNRSVHSHRVIRAFTLIELLVAVAVLALLSVLLLQMIGMSSSVISTSTKKLDGLLGAQFVLDRIGFEGVDGRRIAEGRLGQNRGMRAVRLGPAAGAEPQEAPPGPALRAVG